MLFRSLFKCGKSPRTRTIVLKLWEKSSVCVIFPFFFLQEKKLLLEKNGPHVARISVFEVCNEFTLFTVYLFSSFVEEVFFRQKKVVIGPSL